MDGHEQRIEDTTTILKLMTYADVDWIYKQVQIVSCYSWVVLVRNEVEDKVIVAVDSDGDLAYAQIIDPV